MCLITKDLFIIVYHNKQITMQKAQARHKAQPITRTNPKSNRSTSSSRQQPQHHRNSQPDPRQEHINGFNSNPETVKTHLQTSISQIYMCLFGQDDLSMKLDTCSPLDQNLQSEIVEQIMAEIQRLQQAQQEFVSTLQILQKNGSKLTNEDKWKMVVVSYRDKVASLEAKIKYEQRAREVLQETARYESEQKQRLTQLNNIKFNKIELLLHQKQSIQGQLEQMNQTVSELSTNLVQLQHNNTLLHEQLMESSKINEHLTQQLENVKEQSMAYEQEKNIVKNEMKVLGDQQESINRQISDLKTKYQIEIAQLQHKISMLTIQEQQYLLTIEDLQQKGSTKYHLKDTMIDSQTQTEAQITTKACYFNSLAQDLDDQSYTDEEQQFDEPFSNHEFQLGKQQVEVQSQGEEEPDLFELPLGSMSASNHMVYTDRPAKEKDDDNLSERGQNMRRSQLSFGEAESMISNTPSHYLQTMGELTASLAEAYQKINQLTQQVNELEEEKKKVEHKLKQKEGKKSHAPVQHRQEGKSYFSSFFRK